VCSWFFLHAQVFLQPQFNPQRIHSVSIFTLSQYSLCLNIHSVSIFNAQMFFKPLFVLRGKYTVSLFNVQLFLQPQFVPNKYCTLSQFSVLNCLSSHSLYPENNTICLNVLCSTFNLALVRSPVSPLSVLNCFFSLISYHKDSNFCLNVQRSAVCLGSVRCSQRIHSASVFSSHLFLQTQFLPQRE
jgi:hypothetical protein